MGRRSVHTAIYPALLAALVLLFLPGARARAEADAERPIRHAPPPYAHPQEPTGFLNFAGGVYEPTDQPGSGFYGTLTVGSEVKMLDLGVQISWYHRSSNSGQYQTTYAGPGGTVVERTVLANAYDTDLMPLLAIARYRFAPPTDAVQPYVGGGIGYEWLWISTQGAVVYDPYGYPYYSEVGTSYGGFGGMALAGANFKITPTSAVYVEGEYNWSTVSADYYDPYYNVTVRESINMDGLGIQGGFRFRF